MTKQLTVEVLTASDCSNCQRTKSLVKEVIAELDDNRIEYREVNVVEEIDYAVSLGVLRIPAIALNGNLVFSSHPTAVKLRLAIQRYLEK